jgi:hypothetical protein
MPDVVLDYHRYKTPIDHPDLSVTRGKLEYPTTNVSFAYLSAIGKAGGNYGHLGFLLLTIDSFTDKAVLAWGAGSNGPFAVLRYRDRNNYYYARVDPAATTRDHYIGKVSAGTDIVLASEAVDVDDRAHSILFSISGTTLTSRRDGATTPQLSVSDTTFSSGPCGIQTSWGNDWHSNTCLGASKLMNPASPLPSAQTILELSVEGSGKPEDPFRPSMNKNLVEIASLAGLPDFLYLEAKRYDMLKAKGFTNEEMKLFLGYIPQHQVDLDAVTWGSFEFSEKSPTNIIMIYGDNPYRAGAIQRQIDYAKSKNLRVFSPPKDYGEAVALYNKLKGDFKHWLAGVHNWCYQIFGLEEFDLLQNVDFYYGELIEHKTHYQQLKQVPDWEMRNRLNELRGGLSKVGVLADERDKHLKKIDEILKRGW